MWKQVSKLVVTLYSSLLLFLFMLSPLRSNEKLKIQLVNVLFHLTMI